MIIIINMGYITMILTWAIMVSCKDICLIIIIIVAVFLIPLDAYMYTCSFELLNVMTKLML